MPIESTSITVGKRNKKGKGKLVRRRKKRASFYPRISVSSSSKNQGGSGSSSVTIAPDGFQYTRKRRSSLLRRILPRGGTIKFYIIFLETRHFQIPIILVEPKDFWSVQLLRVQYFTAKIGCLFSL